MARIHGVETEYGLLARLPGGVGRGRLSPAEAAQALFAPIEQETASSNVFLRNGGRLYLDVGSHPEYATPECLDVDALLVAERAGDEIVARLAGRAEQEAAAEGRRLEVRVFKNNADSHGNSYGCHENYSVARDVDLAELAKVLTAFLVTRQVLCGAGRWTPEGFLVSQRADHLHEQLSALTTRSRPLINTRDEPLADPARFRRLHVMAGDSNLSEPSARLKVGTTALVLHLAERALTRGDAQLPEFVLADPAQALRDVARDPRALVELAGGGWMPALEVQRAHLDSVGPEAPRTVTSAWADVLDALDAGAEDDLEADLEWVAKRRLLQRYAARHGSSWADRRLAQVDLAFHDITAVDGRPRGLFRLLEASGAVRRLTEPGAVERALADPPSPTRALLRAQLIEAAQRQGRRYTADWASFTAFGVVDQGGGRTDLTVRLADPYVTSDPAADDLLAALGRRWTPSG